MQDVTHVCPSDWHDKKPDMIVQTHINITHFLKGNKLALGIDAKLYRIPSSVVILVHFRKAF